MENTVENLLAAQAQDDAAAPASPTLEEALTAPQTDAQPAAEDKPAGDTGWFKKRMEDAVRKATPEIEARVSSRYEAELETLRNKVAQLQSVQLEREAESLVASGEFKSLERATEYLKLKGGMPIEETKQVNTPQVRDSNGRFVSAQQRANELFAEAQTIKDTTGVDVYAMYTQDPEVKQKILSGEWRFKDVYNAHKEQEARKATPAPVRSSNGMAIGDMSIAKMSASNFDQLNALLAQGKTIDMRR